MDNIIVPTDFSKKAQYAANLAFDLAKIIGCKVSLVHCKGNEDDEDEMLSKLKGIHSLYPESSCELIIKPGDLIETLKSMIDSEKETLIVMGSQGMTDDEGLTFGSRSQKAVRLINCPLLFVKNPVEIKDIHSIIFASDFNQEAQKAFESVLYFARVFNAEVHLLTIDVPAYFHVPRLITRQSMKQFKDMAGDVKCVAHDIADISVASGIANFAKEVKADIVALGTYGKKFSRIFAGSIAEAMVGSLDIPVMTINIKN